MNVRGHYDLQWWRRQRVAMQNHIGEISGIRSNKLGANLFFSRKEISYGCQVTHIHPS